VPLSVNISSMSATRVVSPSVADSTVSSTSLEYVSESTFETDQQTFKVRSKNCSYLSRLARTAHMREL
jgi:hypothetical protein